MSDWSSMAAQRTQQKLHQERIENERAVREERLLWTKTGPLWVKLRKALMDECADFNAEQGTCAPFEWHRDDSLKLRIDNTRQRKFTSLSFDFQSHHVSTRGATCNCYRIAVVPGTYGVSFVDAFHCTVTVDQIVHRILEDLLGI